LPALNATRSAGAISLNIAQLVALRQAIGLLR
jgi:hypothetical protein